MLQFARVGADTCRMDDLIETRWTRYGKDRVYVAAGDGAKVGYVDLVAGTVETLAPGYDAVMNDCLHRWLEPVPGVAIVEAA